MKTLIRFFPCILIFFTSCELEKLHINAAPPVTFEEIPFQATDRLNPIQIIEHEGGFIVTGWQLDDNSGQNKGFYLRVDGNGVLRYYTLTSEFLNDQISINGEVIVCGSTPSGNNQLVVRGVQEEFSNTIVKNYSLPPRSSGFAITATQDGNLIVGGSINDSQTEGILIKLDPELEDTVWTKRLSTAEFGSFNSVQKIEEQPDGSLKVFNGSYFILLDEDGGLINKVEVPRGVPNGQSVLFKADGGFLTIPSLFTTTVTPPAELENIDPSGQVLGLLKYRDIRFFNAIAPTRDGGFVICGKTSEFGNGQFDAFLLKVDVNMEEEWFRTFGGDLNEEFYNALQTSDGGFVLVGTEQSVSSTDGETGNLGLYLIKTDFEGMVR